MFKREKKKSNIITKKLFSGVQVTRKDLIWIFKKIIIM